MDDGGEGKGQREHNYEKVSNVEQSAGKEI